MKEYAIKIKDWWGQLSIRNDWQLTHHVEMNVPGATVNNKQNSLISAIPTEHLFGHALDVDVPTTNLQLRVTGIVKSLSQQNSLSKVYISIAGQPSKIYHLNDELPYGVKVYAIKPSAVIVENNGHLEKILLPREKILFINRKNKGDDK